MPRVTPHTLAPVKASVEDTIYWKLVILHPRPEARAAGMRAFDADAPRSENPFERMTAEWANWDRGWDQRCEENS